MSMVTGAVTLKEFMEESYIPYFKKVSKASTFRGEKSRISVILNSELALKRLCDIKQSDIIEFLSYQQRCKDISLAMYNRYRVRLSGIFSIAVTNELITKNVVKGIRTYKEKPRSTVLSEHEIKNLLEATKRSRNNELYLIVVIALNTGMRRGEILGLKRTNIVDGNIVLKDNETKSDYGRVIPMNEVLNKELTKFLRNLPNNQERLFVVNDIKRSFTTSRSSAGLIVRFHDLRRTYATHLKNKGVHIYDIMKILGHSDITTTQRYLHSDYNVLRDSVNRVNFC